MFSNCQCHHFARHKKRIISKCFADSIVCSGENSLLPNENKCSTVALAGRPVFISIYKCLMLMMLGLASSEVRSEEQSLRYLPTCHLCWSLFTVFVQQKCWRKIFARIIIVFVSYLLNFCCSRRCPAVWYRSQSFLLTRGHHKYHTVQSPIILWKKFPSYDMKACTRILVRHAPMFPLGCATDYCFDFMCTRLVCWEFNSILSADTYLEHIC